MFLIISKFYKVRVLQGCGSCVQRPQGSFSAINAEGGHETLEEFGKKWNEKYPMIQASWQCKVDNWDVMTPIFKFSKVKTNI